MKPTIQKIVIPGLTINARVWGPEDGFRVLAMHGWLDNAATFDLLAPLLENCRIVSVDFPGHGFSDRMPACSTYHHSERVIQMLQVADALGWDTFSIMGHSMGGVIGMFMAAVLPERIEKIVAIDVTPFLKVFGTDFVSTYRKYIIASHKDFSSHAIYSSYEEAASRRATRILERSMKDESAYVLTQGGMVPVEGGYAWTFDLSLLLPTLVILTEDDVTDILKNITAPLCLILGKEGIVINTEQYREKLSCIAKLIIHEIPGGHHVHLDDPKSVAAIIKQFFT